MVSVGGDGHFLNCANYIQNQNTSILGINSNPKKSFGFLTTRAIYDQG